MRHGMRVPSAFQAIRSFSLGRSPRTYCCTAGAHMRSRERSSVKAAPMCSLSSTPDLFIMASSVAIWLGVMNTDSSPGSLKSACAASSGSEASELSPAARSLAAARRQRIEEPELPVVIDAEVAVGGIRVLPRDHEYRMAFLDQVAHQ